MTTTPDEARATNLDAERQQLEVESLRYDAKHRLALRWIPSLAPAIGILAAIALAWIQGWFDSERRDLTLAKTVLSDSAADARVALRAQIQAMTHRRREVRELRQRLIPALDTAGNVNDAAALWEQYASFIQSALVHLESIKLVQDTDVDVAQERLRSTLDAGEKLISETTNETLGPKLSNLIKDSSIHLVELNVFVARRDLEELLQRISDAVDLVSP